MKKIKFNRNILVTAIVMLAVGLLIGWLIKPSHAEEPTNNSTIQQSNNQTWTCSMHPQIRQSEPGQCPICGMDLIPLDDNTSSEGDPMEIKMSPTAMQLANVQTAVVGFGMPTKEVRMNGKVQPDERLKYSQVTHLDGRVEQLTINFTGEPVRRGQRIASIYSPELVTAQEELFAAQKIKDMQPGLFTAAKQKLKNWKLSDQQIEGILTAGKAQERFPISADVSGIVMEKKVNLGDYVMRGMPLFDIVDLSRVWVLFDVYESDMSWAKVGSTVSFTIQSVPGENFTGKITFIDPVINPAMRVATARVEIANPSGKLKPEMFASGIIKTQLAGNKESIMAPKTAVMWTGERSVVYVKNTTEQGTSFLMQEVTLGPLVGDNYVVKKGLEPGTEIAVNGTFSIDAAAQLAGKPSMMNPSGGAVMTGHYHGGTAPAAMQPMEVSKPAKAAVKQLFDLYFPMKDALINGDFTTAKKQGDDLKKAFEKTSMGLFSGPAHDHWMKHSGAAVVTLNKLVVAKDLEVARLHFKPLSEQMVALAQAFGPFDSAIYVQHCPMADGNVGADWLSLDKEIRNPYFGEKMLKCGRVTETIK
ncbi:MAG: efflux RND transporter periplasmic adaptor subunit [Saprospiraceae bacterium]|nr:efflux RND transporter periplasmic adaptor subunit [Saprospiraceae bacterium]MCF8251514.1 efflux RND transporter periplasmic adaptor subunit [Saprospiraceae bacterium]MCF8280765.1 efflux RND transporter periplasmic adaptor subunit [Bacteroidales bacterium]MCF8313374.1 efflux RND transporter periplasmic adaptor subunit [Saprospiraceae bacterium]MCF8441806.1 efflux RND transporter periplasmic adaptor subunit [Saprospiraceae bacterium]